MDEKTIELQNGNSFFKKCDIVEGKCATLLMNESGNSEKNLVDSIDKPKAKMSNMPELHKCDSAHKAKLEEMNSKTTEVSKCLNLDECCIEFDALPKEKLIAPDTSSPYIKNLTIGSMATADKLDHVISDSGNDLIRSTKVVENNQNAQSYTAVTIDSDSSNYKVIHDLPNSSSFLLDKSSGSVQLTTPNGSCLRGGSKGEGSSSSGPHVQFETPTPSQDELFIDQNYSFGIQSQNIRPGYLMRLHLDATDSESHGLLCRKRKRQRQISGSSTTSVGSSVSATSDGSEFHRKAPDGGWGWVIVAASFFVHCIADGVTMSFGVLFTEFLDYFKESKAFTSWVGSLFMAIPLLAGPLASVLTDHFGCRKVTIIGAVIASIGFLLSAFADSILVLLVTLGLITGLGLAVCYVAAIVIVAFYFEKKRSLATGIAVAGSGIGTFLFAPFIQHLIENWGWRGSLIILAGIFLNMCVCGTLMRDLEWTKHKSSEKRNGHSSHTTNTSSRPGSTSHSSESLSDNETADNSHQTCPPVNELRRIVQTGDVTALLSPDESPNKRMRSSSMLLLPTFLSRTQTLPLDIIPCLNSRANAFEVVSQMYPHLLSSSLNDQMDLLPPLLSDTRLHQIAKANEVKNSVLTTTITTGPLQLSTAKGGKVSLGDDRRPSCSRRVSLSQSEPTSPTRHSSPSAVLPPSKPPVSPCLSPKRTAQLAHNLRYGSPTNAERPPYATAPLRNMRVTRQSMTFRGAMLNIHRYRLRASSCPDIYRNSMITIAQDNDKSLQSYVNELKDMCKGCVNMPYCLDPGYIIFSISNFILYLFYDTVYMYLIDYAIENGIEEDKSANLISIIGVLNCIGMVGMGYIGDKEWYPLMYIYSGSMVLCGMAIIAMPFVTDYTTLLLLAALFGFFISANYALTSVILVELISLDCFTKAYGLLLLTQGMANLFGPPIVGLMRDTTNNYVVPFVVSGISIIGCGLMLFLIPLLVARNRSRSTTLGHATENRKQLQSTNNSPGPVVAIAI